MRPAHCSRSPSTKRKSTRLSLWGYLRRKTTTEATKSEEALTVAEILSLMTPAFGYTRRLAFFDPFSDVLKLIHRLSSVSSKQLALLQLSTTSVRYG